MALPQIDEKIVALIEQNQDNRIDEKQKNGEVFTPLTLTNAILANFPPLVLKNPHLKWIDTANGIGNMLIVVYYTLMETLKDVAGYKIAAKRSKHIIENMLFMIEKNPECVDLSRAIFKKIDANAVPNIVCADFLTEESIWRTAWQTTEGAFFDVVIGNPPYNLDGIKHKGQKNIYVAFVLKGLDILKPGGYMASIHPPTYRIPQHKIQHARVNLNAIYTRKRILCIKMFSIPATKKMMNVMMNVDFIILQNSAYAPDNDMKMTTLIDIHDKKSLHSIKPDDFIPNFGIPILEKMQIKAKSAGALALILTSEMHAQIIAKGDGNKIYKNIHGIKAKGVKISLSAHPHSLQTKRKLVINGIGSYNYVFYDASGVYGFTQSPIAIIEPTPNTLQLVQSKLFHYLADATKIIGNNFNIQTARFLPVIPATVSIKNANDLYDYFDFTAAERTEIEEWTIPTYKAEELLCE
jgi:hypothetical protein